MTETAVYNTFDTTGEDAARDVWRSLPIAEAYPVGSRWVHPSHVGPVTVTGHRGATVLVDYSAPESGSSDWPRSALDTYGRLAREEDNAPEVAPEGDATFKAGDRVRITHSGNPLRPEIVGKEVTYVGFSPYREPPFNPYEVVFDVDDDTTVGWLDGDNDRRHLYVSGLEHVDTTPEPEPYTPAVGDRVRVTADRDDGDRGIGRVGEITSIDATSEHYRYLMRQDPTEDRGARTWWVAGVELETPPASELTPEVEPYPIGHTFTVDGHGAEVFTVIEHMEDDRVRVEGVECGPYVWTRDRLADESTPVATPAPPVTYSQEDVDRLTREAADAARKEGRDAAAQEAAEHMERIVASAHEYAYNNSLCSQFDRFMVENGLEPRDSWEGVRYDVEVESFTVTARTEEEARDKAREYLADGGGYISVDEE